jgi:AAA domain
VGANVEEEGGVSLRHPEPSTARPVEFAWAGRIAIGKANLLIGNEGVGKGAVVAYLTGGWSRAKVRGAFREPVDVAIIGDEDALDDTWTPRLRAADAAWERVWFPPAGDGDLDVTSTEGIDTLRSWIEAHSLRVVVFDALLDNLGGIDEFRPREVRAALRPLRRLAAEKNVAVVGNMHPRKGEALSFRDLIANSHQFNAVCRSNLLIAQHPDDPGDDEGRRVLIRGKGNLSRRPVPLEFRIASCCFRLNGHDFDQPLATDWRDSDVELEDALPQRPGRDRLRVEAARAWLSVNLTHDWRSSADVKEAGAAVGHRERTVQRALSELVEAKIAEVKEEGYPKRSYWRLASGATTREAGVGATE